MRIGNAISNDPRTPCNCVYCWVFQREPRLKNHATLLEALSDSAVQAIVAKNYDKAKDRIERINQITREIAKDYPENLDRCMFRYNSRMRCHKPLFNGECVSHGKEGSYNYLDLEEVLS